MRAVKPNAVVRFNPQRRTHGSINQDTAQEAETMTMTTTTTSSPLAKADNGVNVSALLGARQALEQAPQAAQFKWRASCEWLKGTHSRSTIGNFFGLGAEQSRNKTFTVEADHPQLFASEDNAPTPVELVLSGLASCLTAGVAAVAQRRGIQLHSVKASLEADMDIQGILGIDDEVRNGFGAIRIHFEIRADASAPRRAAFSLPGRFKLPVAALCFPSASTSGCRVLTAGATSSGGWTPSAPWMFPTTP